MLKFLLFAVSAPVLAITLFAQSGAILYRVDGLSCFDGNGGALVSLGEINGDGFGDCIIGAQFENPATGVAHGISLGTAHAGLVRVFSAANGQGFQRFSASTNLDGYSLVGAGPISSVGSWIQHTE